MVRRSHLPPDAKSSHLITRTASVCTCIYPRFPQVQGNKSPGRRIRPHWFSTTAGISRSRHPVLRRLLTRSAIGLDGSIIMYSAFRRLRRVCVHAVRVIEAACAASAPVARPKGHRRKVEEVLIFGCGLWEQLTPFKKSLSLLYCGLFFDLSKTFFKNIFSTYQEPSFSNYLPSFATRQAPCSTVALTSDCQTDTKSERFSIHRP